MPNDDDHDHDAPVPHTTDTPAYNAGGVPAPLQEPADDSTITPAETALALAANAIVPDDTTAILQTLGSRSQDELLRAERSLTAAVERLRPEAARDAGRLHHLTIAVAGAHHVRRALAARRVEDEALRLRAERLVASLTSSDDDADAAQAPARTSVTIVDLSSRRPASAEPLARQRAATRPFLTASGAELTSLTDLARELLERHRGLAGQPRAAGRFVVASAEREYPDERRLTGDAITNAALIAAVTGPEALTASGGFCAPLDSRYQMITLGDAARPLRDALPSFNADRGGIRFITPSRLTDLDAATDVFTEADDDADTSKTTLTVECGVEDTAIVQAVTLIMRVGNFHTRTHPEAWEQTVALGFANHARRAEKALFDAMDADSTAVSATTEYLSATRDILHVVGRAAAAYRSRHRMDPDAVLRWVAPAWIRDGIVVDLAQQAPGDDAIGRAKSEVDGYLSALNVSPVWERDNAPFAAQTASPLLPWPSTFESLLFAEGTFLFLDAGELSLGLVRDSALNLRNDAQFFYESFEAAALVGVESLKLTMDVCFNGLAAGHDDSPRICTGGGS